ncbi:heavy-metal-associated domain-containing protein, partial [Kitasatospora sp. NPDC059803]|uniref:heavy-metal-associated domain-containing protein n=1 Tax=Kitasatospora sp. NPDC059803 TaxID=3346953 RepID=UPI003659A115
MSETTATAESPATGTAASCCGSCGTGATEAPATGTAGRAVFQVKGMTCGHCVTSVTAELRKIDGITDVAVDLTTGKVTVDSTLPRAAPSLAPAHQEGGDQPRGRPAGGATAPRRRPPPA